MAAGETPPSLKLCLSKYEDLIVSKISGTLKAAAQEGAAIPPAILMAPRARSRAAGPRPLPWEAPLPEVPPQRLVRSAEFCFVCSVPVIEAGHVPGFQDVDARM